MTTFYTSDQHFDHENIIKYCDRPFSSVQEMNDAMVYNWNSVVKPTDVTVVLGDVSISKAGLEHVKRLNGRKILVPGNHDSCWSYHKRWQRENDRFVEVGFGVIWNLGYAHDWPLGDLQVNLAHLPYRGTGDHEGRPERYAEQRLDDDGTPLLCGHVHEAWMIKRTEAGTPMVNVGVDQWDFTPVREDLLNELVHGMLESGC